MSWWTCSEVDRHDTAAGKSPHMLLKIPTSCPGPLGGQVHRSARIARLALDAVGHGEPAVVDAFDGSAGLTGGYTEVADRLAGRSATFGLDTS